MALSKSKIAFSSSPGSTWPSHDRAAHRQGRLNRSQSATVKPGNNSTVKICKPFRAFTAQSKCCFILGIGINQFGGIGFHRQSHWRPVLLMASSWASGCGWPSASNGQKIEEKNWFHDLIRSNVNDINWFEGKLWNGTMEKWHWCHRRRLLPTGFNCSVKPSWTGNRKPMWSVAQNHHLMVINETYNPVINACASASENTLPTRQLEMAGEIFRQLYSGNLFRLTVTKRWKHFRCGNLRKVNYRPPWLRILRNIKLSWKPDRFMHWFSWAETVISSPANCSIVYTLQTAFDIIITARSAIYNRPLKLIPKTQHTSMTFSLLPIFVVIFLVQASACSAWGSHR